MSSRSYALLARVHWPPREAAIRALLLRHWSGARAPSRIVDIGCGPGWLASLADSLRCDYIGVDPDPPHSVKHGRVVRGTASDALGWIAHGDVVLLNGTAHHLDDPEFESLVGVCAGTRGLVLCDHARDSATPIWSRMMQRLDRGRHVRDLDPLRGLSGLRLLELSRFPIRVLGLPIWDYFAAAYHPIPEPA